VLPSPRIEESRRTPVTSDLHELATLDIFKTTVQEYECLVKDIFGLLNAYARNDAPLKSPV
jgi:hypothetical protein